MKIKKLLAAFLAVTFICGAFAGCSNNDQNSDNNGGASNSAPKDKIKVKYWHSHKGDDLPFYEKMTEDFNKSQDKYEVESFSVPDKQKIIVAMASDDAPDVVELTNQEITTYVASGLLVDVNSFADKEKYDLTIFSDQSLDANTVDGKLYGLPVSAIVIQMFYNKDLLKSIGYDEPPKTMEELYEMAEKATTTDKDGNIDILGYPLFPLASARQEGIYAFGGQWVAADGVTPTPTNQGIIDSLEMNMNFRKKYGVEKAQKFVATGNTNRYTPQDIFFAGKQLFRFDGPWLARQIKDNNPDVNYGVTMIPGTKANPELRGASRYETVTNAITTNAKQKDGAWEVVKFFADNEGLKDLMIQNVILPAKKSLYDDPEILAASDCVPSFIEALKTENGIQYPKMKEYSKYVALIEEHLDYVYNGTKTPKEAMEALDKQSKNLE